MRVFMPVLRRRAYVSMGGFGLLILAPAILYVGTLWAVGWLCWQMVKALALGLRYLYLGWLAWRRVHPRAGHQAGAVRAGRHRSRDG